MPSTNPYMATPPPPPPHLDTVRGEIGSNDDVDSSSSDGVRALARRKLKRRSTTSGTREQSMSRDAVLAANARRLSSGTARSSGGEMFWESGGTQEEISAAALKRERKHKERSERDKDQRGKEDRRDEKREKKHRSKRDSKSGMLCLDDEGPPAKDSQKGRGSRSQHQSPPTMATRVASGSPSLLQAAFIRLHSRFQCL